MSFVSSLFSGANGAGFQGSSSDLQTPVSKDWAQQAYGQNKAALEQQAQFLQALQAQNGIGNQSQVYNQLQGVANGTGPNPAQAMLNNSTGQNIASQAALMAGQRGAGANTGLIARQAAQQGANTQQQAVGQGAALQAQQSLNAINSAGGIATNQVGQQGNALNAYQAGAANQSSNALNQINAQNNAKIGMQSNVNNVNAGIAQGNQAFQAGIANKGINGVSNLLPFAGQAMAKGGAVENAPKYADGGDVVDSGVHPAIQYMSTVAPGSTPTDLGAPSSSSANQIRSMFQQEQAAKDKQKPGAPKGGIGGVSEDEAQGSVGAQVGAGGMGGLGAADLVSEAAPLALAAAKGGKVPALLSPGEVYLSPGKAKAAAQGKANAMKSGEKIPGKAKVDGAVNSYANDTVPKQLEEGGIVIPRSITQGKNSEEKAMAFVRAVMAHSNVKKSKQ